MRVSQRPEDNVDKIIKRGIAGINALQVEEDKYKKAHKIEVTKKE